MIEKEHIAKLILVEMALRKNLEDVNAVIEGINRPHSWINDALLGLRKDITSAHWHAEHALMEIERHNELRKIREAYSTPSSTP